MSDLTVTILVWAMGGFGGALFVWAVGSDWVCLHIRKSVAGRRCPKCWYDLSHTEGLRCSECGFLAKREGQLGKARWRKRWAVLGVVLLFCCWPLGRYEAIRARGWEVLLPTTALMLILPDAMTQKPINDSRVVEFSLRASKGEIADWQWVWFLKRSGVIRSRERWVTNERLGLEVDPPYWFPFDLEVQVILGDAPPVDVWPRSMPRLTLKRVKGSPIKGLVAGAVPAGGESVEFKVAIAPRRGLGLGATAKENYWEGTISMPLKSVKTVDEVIEPVRGKDVDRLVAEQIRMRLSIVSSDDGFSTEYILSLAISREPEDQLADLALIARIELVAPGGEVSETIRPYGSLELEHPFAPSQRFWFRLDSLTGRRISKEEMSRWTLRLSGDAYLALYALDYDRYWAGTIEYSLGELPWY